MFFIKRHTPETKCSGRIYDRVNVLPINLTTSFWANRFFFFGFWLGHACSKECLSIFLSFPKRSSNITRRLATLISLKLSLNEPRKFCSTTCFWNWYSVRLNGRDTLAVIIMHIRFQPRGIFIYLLKQISFRSRHWHITGNLWLIETWILKESASKSSWKKTKWKVDGRT